MVMKSLMNTGLAIASLLVFTLPIAAGPISVFTQIEKAASGDEIPVSGIGNWAVLTTGGGLNNVATVPANQTTTRQEVVGFWPVMGFRDRAQYDAQLGSPVTVPNTPVTIYAEVWNGEYGQASEVRILHFDTVVSARVGVEQGQSVVDWASIESQQVQFGDTVVSLGYEPVQKPDGVPQIRFEDGSPGIGFPGSVYYPSVLEAVINVTRGPDEPGTDDPTVEVPPSHDLPTSVPEPTSALLLTGFAIFGWAARRVPRRS